MSVIDWTVFDRWPELAIECRCGASFRSRAKITAEGRIATRKPCPKCGQLANARSARSEPETMTIEASVEREACPYCGKERSEEEMKLQRRHGRLQCPECGRDGCFECMPSGRGCACPQCEGSG
jgi:hypothetical protein